LAAKNWRNIRETVQYRALGVPQNMTKSFPAAKFNLTIFTLPSKILSGGSGNPDPSGPPGTGW
jgi:hypothetical protein